MIAVNDLVSLLLVVGGVCAFFIGLFSIHTQTLIWGVRGVLTGILLCTVGFSITCVILFVYYVYQWFDSR